jgi:hypothetical protein
MTRFSTKGLSKTYDKWAGYKSGYKSSSRSYSNSSFWMDDDFLTKETATPGSKIDIVKLAGYKRAIGNFVRIVTGKDDINVSYSSGDDSYTDGKSVVISAKLDENEFDSTVGLALHEGSHIALTDFNLTNALLSYDSPFIQKLADYVRSKGYTVNNDSEVTAKIKALVNIIEDRRIDRFVYDSAPGYQGYYRQLYDKYFNAKEIDNALKAGKFNNLTWEDYEFHICNFANPNRTLDILPGLRDIWNTINIGTISRLKSTQDVFDVATTVFKMIVDQIGWDKQQSGNNSNSQGKQDEAQDNSQSGADVNEDDNNEMGGMDPNMDIPTQGTQGAEQESKEDDVTSEDENESVQDPKDSKQAAKELQEQKKLNDAIQKQKDFLNGNIKKKKLSRKEASKVNAAAESNMEYATVGGDILNDTNNTMKGNTTNCMVVKGIKQSMIDSGLLGGHLSDSTYYDSRVERCYQTDYVQEGIVLGTLLGKRLKTRDEDRTLKTTRMETGRIDRRLIAELGFGNDRVFNQIIHNTVTPSIIHISVDASGSMTGSKWHAAMKTSVAIAKAASMVSSLDCVVSLRGSFGSWESASPLMWIIYDSRKDTFAKAKKHFKMAQAAGSTPEGLCYQAVMKELLDMSNGKEAFFINICDGEPGYSDRNISYGGEYAVMHTAAQIKKMNAVGIKTLGYFVCEDSNSSWMNRSKDQFRRMYGSGSEFIDTNNLTQLSQSLNKLFIRK